MSRTRLSTLERETAEWTAVAGLMLLTMVTAASFARVFAGWQFLWPLLLIAAVVHLFGAGIRRLRAPAWLAIASSLLLLVTMVSWIHYRDSLWGVLPSRATATLAGSELSDAWRLVGDVVPPVAHQGGFGVIAALTVGLVAILADAFAFRAGGRTEALVPSGVVFVAVSAVGIDRLRIASSVGWLVAALAVVALLRSAQGVSSGTWIGTRPGAAWARWSAGGIAMALVAGTVAGVAGPHIPGAGAKAWFDPDKRGGVTEVVSPLVDIQSRLTDRSSTVLFTVTAPEPSYWRLTGLSNFDGRRWALPESSLDEAAGVLAPDAGITQRVDQVFQIDALGGNLVPVAFAPVELRASTIELYYVADTGTLVVSDDSLKSLDTYEIVSAVPRPTADRLRRATMASPPNAAYLALPDDFPAEFVRTAQDITAAGASPYDKVLLLQNYFREFTYDLTVRSGHGTDAIADFLARRSGYCEQFAGTFAAFARALGIPARVAVGFTPGERGADGKYRVRSLNAHAWPEVWFDKFGWVAFEPTPLRGEPGAEEYTGIAPAQEETTFDSEGAAPAGPPVVAPTTTLADQRDETGATNTLPPPPPTDSGQGGQGAAGRIALGLLALAAAWMLLMPAVVRVMARRRRSDEVVGVWNELCSTLSLAGIGATRGETPLEHARRVSRLAGLDAAEMRTVAGAATAAVYGRTALDDATVDRVRTIGAHLIASARSMLSVRQRLRGRIDPRVARDLTGC